MTVSGLQCRSAHDLMGADRACGVVPDALSFPRAAMRELVGGRFRVTKLRFELDAEGRGEILYQLSGAGRVFHFFLVSNLLPEDKKTDRNFAASWDAMGVLCQGEWTAQREALLRREVPKQRAGFSDYDTLIYARGNRSARLFDHVVDSLSAGRQPDLKLLAPVGYILRTTAFIGNGQLGTRPLDGYDAEHPLRRPYHAQFCSALMLREYVFDLVDHLARVRSSTAVRLAPEYRRFLGLGNSAATGLAAYATNHPHQMHRWSLVHEEALVLAVRRMPVLKGEPARKFVTLLRKAIGHFVESAHASDGVFSPPQDTAQDLRRIEEVMEARQASVPHDFTGTDEKTISLEPLIEWARGNVRAEACEVLHSLVLELHPDVVAASVDRFWVDEDAVVKPAMTVGVLLKIIEREFDWVIEGAGLHDDSYYFWYRASSAPRDVRRGVRTRLAHLEFETNMDFPLRVRETYNLLRTLPPSTAIAVVLCEKPELRHAVALIQSLEGARYNALRQPWLSRAYSPFGAIRFVLAFYGMEKFEAAFPKSVRGTFMQGAPIAEDVQAGRDGPWPFTLMPDATQAKEDEIELAPLPATAGYATDVSTSAIAVGPAVLRVAPRELARALQTALQGHGMPLGVAEEAGMLVTMAQVRDGSAVPTALRHCAERRVGGFCIPINESEWSDQAPLVVNANSASALAVVASALDLASWRCCESSSGMGAVLVSQAHDAWLASAIVGRGARHGMTTVFIWRASSVDSSAACGFACATPGQDGGTYQVGPITGQGDSIAEKLARDHMGSSTQGPSFFLACVRSASGLGADGKNQSTGLAAGEEAALIAREGVAVSRADYDALLQAGAALLVPQEVEHLVLHEGMDPLKNF